MGFFAKVQKAEKIRGWNPNKHSLERNWLTAWISPSCLITYAGAAPVKSVHCWIRHN